MKGEKVNKDLLRQIAAIRRGVREATLAKGSDRDTMVRLTLDAAKGISQKGVNLDRVPGALRIKGMFLKDELLILERQVQAAIREVFMQNGYVVVRHAGGLRLKLTGDNLAALGLLQ